MSKQKTTLQDVIVTLQGIAQSMGKPVQKVTERDCEDNGLSGRQIRKFGGLPKIKKAHFPETEKSLGDIVELSRQTSYINKLEKLVGTQELLEREFKKALDKLKPIPKIKFRKAKAVKKSQDMVEMVGMLNDTHIGLIVDPEEIGNGNSFDFKEACRRFAFYTKQVGEYKKDKRDRVSKLHLILNGDLLAGIIHGLETKGIHLLVHQINAAVHIFTHVVANLAKEYSKIEVHGIAGNHDRVIHKDHGKRPVSEVYDSYANMIYYALSVAFRNNPEITFNFPKTAYGFIDLPAGRAMYCHGDHIFSKALGYPGNSINVKGLSAAIRDFNAGEIAKGKPPIKLLLLAHVHTFAHFITSDGVEVYIAPSLVGLDAFAHSLTHNQSFVAQVVFESAKDFILGDSRLIRLSAADKDESLDNIIPTYNKELKWSK